MLAKEDRIIDASFVTAPKQRNNRKENTQIKEGKRPEGFVTDTVKE
jgi:hypothetical protein